MNDTSGTEVFEADLLVIGAGMAGSTAAGYAAAQGLRVVLVEKNPQLGGNAVLSGGFVWTAGTWEKLRHDNPLGDPELNRVLLDDYQTVIDWISSLGVEMSDRRNSSNMGGTGHLIDVIGYVNACARLVEGNGGVVLRGATVSRLLTEGGAVVGGIVVDADGETTVRSGHVVLATGGFQADADLRRRYIHEQAETMLVRSNPASTGDGLRLGVACGAALVEGMDGFYGHPVAYPLEKTFVPGDFLRLSQAFHSVWGVLLDVNGTRFVDESLGHYVNAQAIVRAPGARALLVADAVTHRENATTTPLKGVEAIDLPAEAQRAGAHVAFADTLEALAEQTSAWGYNAAAVLASVKAFNDAVLDAPETLEPAREKNRRPVAEGPFYAIEVQPAITFTHGGVRIDTQARVLDDDGAPIPGLLAAGADGAGVFHRGYASGLTLGAVFGRRAALQAASEQGATATRTRG